MRSLLLHYAGKSPEELYQLLVITAAVLLPTLVIFLDSLANTPRPSTKKDQRIEEAVVTIVAIICLLPVAVIGGFTFAAFMSG